MTSVVAFLLLVHPPREAEGYEKLTFRIPMRDGVKLYTAVYVPKDQTGFPILMERTPYSSEPYGEKEIPDLDAVYVKNGFAFASQDVRGQYMSEGKFMNVRPGAKVDESTDTYDTIEYLVNHVKGNNGRVGLRGISYPGFYAAVGALSRHPALKAVSPQAPCIDWFRGDDVHHNGAFFLQDNFGFSAWFDSPRKGLEKTHAGLEIPPATKGAYDFYLDAGTAEGLEKKYLKGRLPYWKEVISHPNYDAYWKERALNNRMTDVKCAVLNVGGWYDAEDMWGALNLYSSIERQNPGIENTIVMGPWSHGQWYGEAKSLGGMEWGMDTGAWYRDHVEVPFFVRTLKGGGSAKPPEATMFETGANKWRTFDVWPPKTSSEAMYLAKGGLLSSAVPAHLVDSYVNDPNNPTPYLADPKRNERPGDLLTQDETWASKRADVLTYIGPPLEKAKTLAGPVEADLWVRITGEDADFVVKLLDIAPAGEPHAGEMRMVRADIMRGRFRNSLETPEPFRPGQPEEIKFKMNDVLHTFKPGHRMAVQVQSSWFPLVDRNPNTFVDIATAKPSDFKKTSVYVMLGGDRPSAIRFGVLGE